MRFLSNKSAGRRHGGGRRPATFLTLLTLASFCDTAAMSGESDQFLNVERAPDALTAELETGAVDLHSGGNGRWRGGVVIVTTPETSRGLEFDLSCSGAAIKNIALRWQGAPPADWKYLGDASRAWRNDSSFAADAGRPTPGKSLPPYWQVMGYDDLSSWVTAEWNLIRDGIGSGLGGILGGILGCAGGPLGCLIGAGDGGAVGGANFFL